MKIVSFNINGLRARLHQLQSIIEQHQPDVIGLQEIKVCDEQFPETEVRQLGYHVYYHGQKGHYGVALMSKIPAVSITKGFPSDNQDAQRRFIYGEFLDNDNQIVTVMNGYFPQGESRNHPTKFPNKVKFYADLQQMLEKQFSPQQSIVIMGDFNISPQDIDIGIGEHNRLRWLKTGKCSFLPEEREMWQRLLAWGLDDSYRYLNQQQNDVFSWFDYRSKGFDDQPKRGLRIDVILTSLALRSRIEKVGVDYAIRGMEKPSDHAPIWLQLAN